MEKYKAAGFEVLHTPITDQGVPTAAQAESLIAFLKKNTGTNQRVVLHCVGGLGRTGVAAALYLKKVSGLTGRSPIDKIRAVRSPRAIENLDQENFILNC